MANIVVLGAGAWGTALAVQACRGKNKVTLWAYMQEEKDDIQRNNENTTRLPGVKVPAELFVTCDLNCVAQADVILLVVPAQSIRKFLPTIKPYLRKQSTIIICSKGIEIESGQLLSDVCEELYQILILQYYQDLISLKR